MHKLRFPFVKIRRQLLNNWSRIVILVHKMLYLKGPSLWYKAIQCHLTGCLVCWQEDPFLKAWVSNLRNLSQVNHLSSQSPVTIIWSNSSCLVLLSFKGTQVTAAFFIMEVRPKISKFLYNRAPLKRRLFNGLLNRALSYTTWLWGQDYPNL